MIYFIGAGPGAPDLITVRGMHLLQHADLVIYAGSLVNPELLSFCPPSCPCLNSAEMTLEEIISAMAVRPKTETVIRLHTGDPSLYGAVREQMDALDELQLPYEVVPGVSSMSAAAAALRAEFTPPEISQTVIISRMAGRTAVPDAESIRSLAAHGSTMILFLSAGMLPKLCQELIAGGYPEDTTAAVVYRASWPDEEIILGNLKTLPGQAAHIRRTALILVGRFLSDFRTRSRLYDPAFSHLFREGHP
ncbi:MAG: precorrin-4 C(11)-methyltransferase [Clostridia bacterium]|nr:precorrin-4 C(11)-methyltransferase [Clostridia bacterium]